MGATALGSLPVVEPKLDNLASIFMAGILVGLLAPRLWPLSGILIAIPGDVARLQDVGTKSVLIVSIAVWLWSTSAITATAAGYVLERVLGVFERVRKWRSGSEIRQMKLAGPARAAVFIASLGAGLSKYIAEAWPAAAVGAIVGSLVLCFVSSYKQPSAWWEAGLASGVVVLTQTLFSDSNLLPFEVASGYVLAAALLASAALARGLRGVLGRG